MREDDSKEEVKIEIKNELKYSYEKNYHDKHWIILYFVFAIITLIIFVFGLIKYLKNGIPEEYTTAKSEKDKLIVYFDEEINSNIISKLLSFYSFLKDNEDIEYLSIFDHNLIIYSSCIIIPMVASFLYLILLLILSGKMVYMTFIFGFIIIMTVVIYIGVELYIEDTVSTNGFLVILCLIIIIVFIILLIKWWSGIKMSVAFLNIAVFIMKKYPSTILFSFLNIAAQSLINSLFVACLCVLNVNIKNYDYKDHGYQGIKNALFDFSHMSFLSGLITTFLGISYLFNKTVLENIIYSTISGVFSLYLFNTVDKSDVRKYPLFFSFKNAVSKNLGSLCFGSLTYSIIHVFQTITDYVKFVLYYGGFWILDFFLYRKLSEKIKMYIDWSILLPWTLVDYLLKMFNEDAFALMVIKDCSYREASKEFFVILKEKEDEIEYRELIIGRILNIYKLIIYIFGVGTTVMLSIFLYQPREETVFYFFLSLASSNAIYSSISEVINSAVNTTFLCYCGVEDCLNNIDSNLISDIIYGDDDDDDDDDDNDDDIDNENNDKMEKKKK